MQLSKFENITKENIVFHLAKGFSIKEFQYQI